MTTPSKAKKPVLASLMELANSISDWGSNFYSLKRLTLVSCGLAIALVVSLLAMYFGLVAAWVVFILSILLLVVLGLAELLSRFQSEKD